MESITVKIKYKEYKASLELNNKITVVVGLSATGKSTIHKVLDVKDNRKAIDISNKRYELQYIRDESAVRDLLENGCFKKYRVYVIDEGSVSIDDEIASLIKKSTLVYFIITTRKKLGKLNFSLDSVKQLVPDSNGVIHFKSYITLTRQTKPELIQSKIDYIIIEDSGKAKEWFKSLFRDSISIESPGNGKEQVCDLAKDRLESYTNILLIFDECSFGACIEKLASLIFKFPNRITLLSDYKSWEYLILRSNFYRDKMTPYSVLSNEFEERYYENHLSELSRQSGRILHIDHDKGGKLSKCYTDACCAYSGINNRECDIGLKGDDKFIAMFKGTEFENILIIAKRVS